MPSDPWARRFRTPVPLPGGGALATLADARAYILERDEPTRFATAIEVLLLVVEHNGPTDFARIGMMQALYPDPPPRVRSTRKFKIIR